jgi:carboxypeptidase C (cathepsin A)
MRLLRTALLALFVLAPIASAAFAEDQPAQARAVPAGEPQGVLRLLPGDAVSEKSVTIAGRPLAYTTTAGTLSLYDQNGERSAAVFYVAYVAKDADRARRPLTFVFNGGPGAASAFLHLGLAGPRIVEFGSDGRDGAAARLVDNPDTWLAFTDLVMIDPVGTGWSRPAKADNGSAFWSVRRDAESLAKVIALYVAHNSRQASPKYLLGESYGGFRAAKVARALQSDQGIVLSGILMVSPMIEAAYTWGHRSDALTAALHFPSLVATELERTKTFTPEAMAEAERFALTEYLSTLAGPPPTGERAQAFYGRIAAMTGLSLDAVTKARGHVRSAYVQRLREQGVRVSSYDASFAVPDPFPESAGERGPDPMLDGFVRALAGAMVGYARDELGFKTDITYLLLNHEVSGKWEWGGNRERQGVSEDLRILQSLDPSLRLLVAHGRSDLVTPYGVSRYLIDQLPSSGTSERTQFRAYRGGHMFYLDPGSRRAFTTEATEFYQAAR